MHLHRINWARSFCNHMVDIHVHKWHQCSIQTFPEHFFQNFVILSICCFCNVNFIFTIIIIEFVVTAILRKIIVLYLLFIINSFSFCSFCDNLFCLFCFILLGLFKILFILFLVLSSKSLSLYLMMNLY